jgi:hypothetical protein
VEELGVKLELRRMMIRGAQGVAVAAAIGNLLQGWDGGAIAGMCPVCEQALPHALISSLEVTIAAMITLLHKMLLFVSNVLEI